MTARLLLAFTATAAWVAAEETWSVHAQATWIEQGHAGFPAAYSGSNSLLNRRENQHTATVTAFLGRRLWPGGEFYYNPEVTQGSGLSGTLGAAGFPNGEATRAGSANPEYDTARLFFRQVFPAGGGTDPIPPDKNQLGGAPAADGLTLTLGKLSASDLFDTNRYSHDPRTQFLNWSLMENGAWDYPADVKGYTGGFAAEWKAGDHTVRAGSFLEPAVANGRTLDKHLARAWGEALEFERRYQAGGRPGALRLLGYWNRAHMGSYVQAVRSGDHPPDVTLSRSYRSKGGLGLNWEQELAGGAGVFARAGWSDGHAESWAFTEIDRTLSGGAQIEGKTWHRPDDVVGIAAVANGLSPEHRRYLAAGGTGFIVGDGALRYASEEILEVYYNWRVIPGFAVAFDGQRLAHPGYNRARGPANLYAVRAHWEL